MKINRLFLISAVLIISFFTIISSAHNTFFIQKSQLHSDTYSTNLLKKTYYFSQPIIQQVSIENKTYSSVTMDGLSNMDDPGSPLLPSKGSFLLLPPNKKIVDISIVSSQPKIFSLNHPVLPGEHPIHINSETKPIPPTPNQTIYQESSSYPSSLYSKIGTYNIRGYPILILRLHPIQYHPLENTISYHQKLIINITFESQTFSQSMLRNKNTDLNYVKEKIDNPSTVQAWIQPLKTINTLSDELFDLLILTIDEFEEEFTELKQFHESNGLKTQIHTLTDIKPLNPKSVSADDIRSYIKSQYLESGIEYVLLGGDTQHIPAKMLYVHGMDEGKNPMETIMPADFFYGCLDGPFNFDEDSLEGEPTDGENGKDIDLFAEVFIGRAAGDTKEDIQRFISKTITYHSTSSVNESTEKILMAGEYLGDYGIASWGGNYLDLLLNESTADDYNTVGIPNDEYDIIKLYDRDLQNKYWSPEMLLNLINENVHIINHDGHSYYGYNMRLTNDAVQYMENSFPFFVYSIGCMAGGFDNPEGYDCFAEHVTVKSDHGAFAALMNARYGFFWSYSTDGDGTRYTREFWDAVFGENIPCISKAHQDSREDNVYLIDRSCMRWSYYGLNLFADPTIVFHLGKSPETPVLTGPNEIKVNENAVFEVKTNDEDSNQLLFLFDWDDGSTSGWIGPMNINETCSISHSWNESGTFEIKVKAKDETGLESPWAIQPIETPYNRQNHNILDFFNEFFPCFLNNLVNNIITHNHVSLFQNL
ncbi:MAG TPA: C25 family cysteine peptidase [Candidatus Thermoplasmatota archaeon]|nr:C25 family cysteine peptidase [Candidatus Thermoplasmatota archaeon]